MNDTALHIDFDRILLDRTVFDNVMQMYYIMIMNKTTTISARIEPALKKKAGAILRALGISHSDLVSMTYRQVVRQRGVPFDVKVPNATTRKIIEDVRTGKGKRFNTVQELMDEINRD